MEYNTCVDSGERNIFKPLAVANEKMHSFELSDYE
jgi:hypothetical protein